MGADAAKSGGLVGWCPHHGATTPGALEWGRNLFLSTRSLIGYIKTKLKLINLLVLFADFFLHKSNWPQKKIECLMGEIVKSFSFSE